MSAREAGRRTESVIRTAIGMPDNRSSTVLRVADGEQLGRSLAPAVLGGGWCALVPAEQPLEIGAPASAQRGCQRREPKKTLLHRIVRENLATFLVEAQERDSSGELPPFIRAEFERYLRCGLLCHGFSRVRCPTCRDELLVAFSCENRGRCPSCACRRMADSFAHLRDHVLPAVAVREWVLTLPVQFRFVIAWRPKLIGLALTLFLRALFAW